ncbi:MAG: 30S ribosomal protein S9 [Anaerolineales bacterium]|nr:30S ribosomal protein S9 [Anaerolineales bacterium]
MVVAVEYYEGIGRRKESTARVRIAKGTGQFVVNGKNLDEYFTRQVDIVKINAPFSAADENRDQFDVSVIVKGGGITGQAEAVQLGASRALLGMNPDIKTAMRKAGLLTRDSRIKERKKPGLKRARKAPTYTKR